MSGDKDALLGMGFEAARVEWALKATGNRGLQPAMDFLFENEGKPIPDLGTVTESSSSRPTDMDVDDDEDAEALKSLGVTDAEAKSIKCSLCGKIFKNTALANFHAEKSGHDQFEESTEEVKPLTEEEKKEKLAELRAKLAEKRAKKDQEEIKANKANENLRRKAGKDINQLREDIAAKQAIKEAEDKKKEKLEDARHKAAIKAQIEADKKARAEKAAREKALREGKPLPGESSQPAAPAPKPAAAATSGVAGKDFQQTRLQIRLSTGGQPFTTTLPSDAKLREVAEFIAGQDLSVDPETVTLAQHFPRKTFAPSDFSKTLRDLGLTPSAVLIATP